MSTPRVGAFDRVLKVSFRTHFLPRGMGIHSLKCSRRETVQGIARGRCETLICDWNPAFFGDIPCRLESFWKTTNIPLQTVSPKNHLYILRNKQQVSEEVKYITTGNIYKQLLCNATISDMSDPNSSGVFFKQNKTRNHVLNKHT